MTLIEVCLKFRLLLQAGITYVCHYINSAQTFRRRSGNRQMARQTWRNNNNNILFLKHEKNDSYKKWTNNNLDLQHIPPFFIMYHATLVTTHHCHQATNEKRKIKHTKKPWSQYNITDSFLHTYLVKVWNRSFFTPEYINIPLSDICDTELEEFSRLMRKNS